MNATSRRSITRLRAPALSTEASSRPSPLTFENVTSPAIATSVVSASTADASTLMTAGSGGIAALQLEPHEMAVAALDPPARGALIDEVEPPAARPLGRDDRALRGLEAGPVVGDADVHDVAGHADAELQRAVGHAGVTDGVGDELGREQPQVGRQLRPEVA